VSPCGTFDQSTQSSYQSRARKPAIVDRMNSCSCWTSRRCGSSSRYLSVYSAHNGRALGRAAARLGEGRAVERFLKWLLPALIVVEIVLVRGGVLSLGQAVAIVVAIEGGIALIAARQAIVAVRRFRAGRRDGVDPWTAAEDALTVVFPRVMARFIVMEPRVWICLIRWVTRRYRYDPDDFPYHAGSILGIFLVVILFTTPVEIILFELLIPWAWLRWILLILAIYAVVWAFGLYASLVVLPHRLEPEGLRVRYGVLNEAVIPYDRIVGLEEEQRKTPDGREGLIFPEGETGVAFLSIGGRTHLRIEVDEPVRFRTFTGPSRPINVLSVAANHPDRLGAALRERLPSRRRDDPDPSERRAA